MSLEFRSVFFFRVGLLSLASKTLRWLYPPMPTLFLGMRRCGPGLYVQHGFSTIVTDVVMGSNCWINQQVTIGRTERGAPTIGDNVTIHAGAIVIDDVVIGNAVTVGAGAVVTKSIPDKCVVVGNPAYILKRDGIRVDEPL